ncbi:hypothetical protein [Nocardioides xinjiangensis]|uniref:hypothetical protein n=1 Tax=Nocardioides xinjiangensis TaxID=2817376 RepID=UPI001B30211B|nr:hypothetical protein [Nocardioides sp. SYSU D00778]
MAPWHRVAGVGVISGADPSPYGTRFALWRTLHACTPRLSVDTAPDTKPTSTPDPTDSNGYSNPDASSGNNPGVTGGGDSDSDNAIETCLDSVDAQAGEVVAMLNQGLISEADYERLMAENSEQSRNCLDLR